jgi:hypothetical protein
MDCAGVRSRLVGYHFAALADDERDAVDAHLLGCGGCLRAYLAFKRATETRKSAEAIDDRPSPEIRRRLRAEVAASFASGASELITPARPNVAFLARRIPLYQGLAFAAIAAAITLLAIGRARAVPVREGVPEVDSSRPRAESLQIY